MIVQLLRDSPGSYKSLSVLAYNNFIAIVYIPGRDYQEQLTLTHFSTELSINMGYNSEHSIRNVIC